MKDFILKEKHWKIIYCLFFFAIFSWFIFLSIMAAMAVIMILNSSPAEIKNYPFGTEQGYAYYSKETYTATNLLWFFAYGQSAAVALYLYFIKRKSVAISILLLPLLLSYFFYSLGL